MNASIPQPACPDFATWNTRDLCALYEAALALDEMAVALSNTPKFNAEDYGTCVRQTPAGAAVVAWANAFSDMRDDVVEELRRRPVSDWTFMTMVGHLLHYGDDLDGVVDFAAGLRAQQRAAPLAAE